MAQTALSRNSHLAPLLHPLLQIILDSLPAGLLLRPREARPRNLRRTVTDLIG